MNAQRKQSMKEKGVPRRSRRRVRLAEGRQGTSRAQGSAQQAVAQAQGRIFPFSSRLKWGLIAIGVTGIGIVLLSVAGRLFIQEVVQEITIEETARTDFGIEIGTTAPHWELPDLAGNSVPLEDFLGEPLVLTFWTTWNSMAVDQVSIFDMYLARFGSQLFTIVAVNNQEDESVVANFVRRGGYSVRVLLDETGEIGEIYNAKHLPVTYFLDRDGIIRNVFVGVLSEEMLVERAKAILR